LTASPPAALGRRSALGAGALVALTVLCAHFTRLGQLGLYEDDYFFIAPHLGEPLGRLWSLARQVLVAWPQGRPLNHLLPPLLGALGSAWGGLAGIYVLAAAWLSLNGLLAWLVARRLVGPTGAVVATVAYLLFPADGTKLFLVHAAHVQGAMTFLLLAWWLWLLGGWRRLLAYPVAALCLLAYESTFLPFLVVPLFVQVERPRLGRTWLAHLGGCALLVGAVGLVRVVMGEARVLEVASQPGDALDRMLSSLWMGPLTSARSLGRSAALGARSLDPLALLAAGVFVLAFLVVLRGAGPRAGDESGLPSVSSRPGAEARPPGAPPAWRVLVGALAGWSLAYALTLVNYPPTQVMGRLTSTHVAAGWPAALALGATFELLRGAGRWRGRLVVALTATWLASLVGYHHLLQRGYVGAWEEERRFWRELTLRSPDVGPGWTVLVAGTPRAPGKAILSSSWSDHLVHRQLYTAAPDGAGISFAHLGIVGRQVELVRDGEAWRWRPAFWTGAVQTIDPSRLALFEDDHGALRRVEAISLPSGQLRTTAPVPSAPRTSWPDTPVARLMFPEAFPAR